jgi:hypothetical protein
MWNSRRKVVKVHLHSCHREPSINTRTEFHRAQREPSQPVIVIKTQFWSRSISLLTLDVIQNFFWPTLLQLTLPQSVKRSKIDTFSNAVNKLIGFGELWEAFITSCYSFCIDFSCGFVMTGIEGLLWYGRLLESRHLPISNATNSLNLKKRNSECMWRKRHWRTTIFCC